MIDIGSNSVRLVVYRLEGRAIWTVFNEKVLAGLGRDLGDNGRLSPDGVQQTLAALKRFRAVLEAVAPAETFVVATAAAREASDGPAFVARVKAETGLTVRVLSGEEEARYAALGVLAGAPQATGVVGDLGGASLELVRLESTGAGLGVTLPLGPFSLGLSDGFDGERVRRLCAQRLAPVASAFKTDSFHAVGGAWRNLALLHMRLSGYPLHVVHQYEISAQEALEAARLVAHQSRSSLERIEGMSKKRSERGWWRRRGAGEPGPCPVAEANRDLGLRRARGPAVRSHAAARARPGSADRGLRLAGSPPGRGRRAGRAPAPCASAFTSLPPLFDDGRDAVLMSAACRLADLGARLHPDHRADLVFEQVLRAPIAGQNHAERAFLAAAAYARHSTAFNPPEAEVLERLLTPARLKRARALGAAIRLGCDLSGRSAPCWPGRACRSTSRS